MKQSRLMDFLAVVATAALIILVFERVVQRRAVEGPQTIHAAPVHIGEDLWSQLIEGRHVWGPSDAPVTIVTFVDFECAACMVFATDTEREVKNSWPNGPVRIVTRHMPLDYHRLARHAARSSECAGAQGRFHAMHDVLFEQHLLLGIKPMVEFAADAGVPDVSIFAECLENGTADLAINEDLLLAAKAGARGTPTVIVNGLRWADPPRRAELDSLLAITASVAP